MRKLIILLGIFFAQFSAAQTVTGTHHLATPAGTSAGETGELRSYELLVNGEDFFAIKAADAMAAPTVYTAPIAFPGSNGFVLASTTGGVQSWVAQTAGGPAGGSLSGTYPNPALAATQPDAHTWSSLQTFAADISVDNSILFPHATFSELRATTADADDTMQLFLGGGGGTGPTRGASFSLFGNEHASRPGEFELEAGAGSDIIFRTSTESGRWDNSDNFIIGAASIVAPTSAVKNLVLGAGIAPSANPASGTAAVWSDGTTGRLNYRTGTASEGAGQTNSIHNRIIHTTGSGTSYTVTTTKTPITFSSGSPTVTIPTAGTWLLSTHLLVDLAAASVVAFNLNFDFRRTNNTAADLTGCRMDYGHDAVTLLTRTLTNLSSECVYTTSNSNDIIVIDAISTQTPSAGTIRVVSVGGYLQAVRLF